MQGANQANFGTTFSFAASLEARNGETLHRETLAQWSSLNSRTGRIGMSFIAHLAERRGRGWKAKNPMAIERDWRHDMGQC